EQELAKLVQLDAAAQLPACLGQGRGLPPDQLGRPVQPTDAPVRILERHEQREVLQPVRLLAAELLEERTQERRGASVKLLPGVLEQAPLEGDDGSIIDVRVDYGAVITFK